MLRLKHAMKMGHVEFIYLHWALPRSKHFDLYLVIGFKEFIHFHLLILIMIYNSLFDELFPNRCVCIRFFIATKSLSLSLNILFAREFICFLLLIICLNHLKFIESFQLYLNFTHFYFQIAQNLSFHFLNHLNFNLFHYCFFHCQKFPNFQ